jgi:PHD/YefM family antitoxin component YafN of YafNO toxin-antitoxin module
MPISTFTSREFNQDVTSAKKAALHSHVQITDRGKVSHILLSVEEYNKITQNQESIVDLLAMPDENDFDFEAPKLGQNLFKKVNLD